jgi:hypothetical protein
MMAEDEVIRSSPGHKNFLKTAVYFLFAHHRLAEAAKWFAYLKQKYPDAVPPEQTYEEFVLPRVEEELGDTSRDRTTAMVKGLFQTSLERLALGDDDAATGSGVMAEKIWQNYMSKIPSDAASRARIGLADLTVLKQAALDELLHPDSELPDELKARLRTIFNLPAVTNAPPISPPSGGSPSNR